MDIKEKLQDVLEDVKENVGDLKDDVIEKVTEGAAGLFKKDDKKEDDK